MGIISKPYTFSPSTTASSSEVNSDFDTIYNEFNGSIAAANLATDAVTTAKIADSNVTTAKIADLNVTTAKLANSSVDYTKVAAGAVVQVVSTNFSAVATGTTVTPFDDTIPQITEGIEFMTRAITPKATTHRLVIVANVYLSHSAANTFYTAALHQDSTANALAASGYFDPTTNGINHVTLVHEMAAGTTSSTTFRIRAGGNNAGTMTFNGTGGARRYGGITLSNITIYEYKA